MNGYDVVTSDEHKIGRVVDERDNCLIVEHGHVFKAKHAIPKAYAHVDDTARLIRATITKDVFTSSPKVTDDWRCNDVLEHYGLVGGLAAPDTEGYGETVPTDPAEAAPDTVTGQRAALRETMSMGEAAPMPAVHDRSRNALDPGGETANH